LPDPRRGKEKSRGQGEGAESVGPRGGGRIVHVGERKRSREAWHRKRPSKKKKPDGARVRPGVMGPAKKGKCLASCKQDKTGGIPVERRRISHREKKETLQKSLLCRKGNLIGRGQGGDACPLRNEETWVRECPFHSEKKGQTGPGKERVCLRKIKSALQGKW